MNLRIIQTFLVLNFYYRIGSKYFPCFLWPKLIQLLWWGNFNVWNEKALLFYFFNTLKVFHDHIWRFFQKFESPFFNFSERNILFGHIWILTFPHFVLTNFGMFKKSSGSLFNFSKVYVLGGGMFSRTAKVQLCLYMVFK